MYVLHVCGVDGFMVRIMLVMKAGHEMIDLRNADTLAVLSSMM